MPDLDAERLELLVGALVEAVVRLGEQEAEPLAQRGGRRADQLPQERLEPLDVGGGQRRRELRLGRSIRGSSSSSASRPAAVGCSA